MKRAKIKLVNDFHGTEVYLMAECHEKAAYLSHAQVQKARKALCGQEDCTCSGVCGQRGYQMTGEIEAMPNGGARILLV